VRVSILGLGYVGAVTAGCLTARGHRVIGADVQQAKVDSCKAGVSPIVEPELSDLLSRASRDGALSATTDTAQAVRESEVSIVCVCTPSLAAGRLNLDYVRKVAKQISASIKAKGSRHVVILRSTMLPGSTRGLVQDFLGADTPVYYCPEFLREGTAGNDFREPSLSVIGTHDGASPLSSEGLELLGHQAEVMTLEGAELIKYFCNYLHALKVGFAKEIGRVSKFVGVDGERMTDVACSDEKLNISGYYMRPGNPYGGSCLPKDVRVINSPSAAGRNQPAIAGQRARQQRGAPELADQADHRQGKPPRRAAGPRLKAVQQAVRCAPQHEEARLALALHLHRWQHFAAAEKAYIWASFPSLRNQADEFGWGDGYQQLLRNASACRQLKLASVKAGSDGPCVGDVLLDAFRGHRPQLQWIQELMAELWLDATSSAAPADARPWRSWSFPATARSSKHR